MEIGIDTLDYVRIKEPDKLAKRVLHPDELVIYNENKSIEYLASRFSLKEAFVKATGLKTVTFKEINIQNDKYGKPYLTYKNYVTSVSISHERTHCVTICLWEGNK